MESVQAGAIPNGAQWQYEPKWDGFRCLAFRDGSRVELTSKSGQPLGRYFPELVNALKNLKAGAFVLDGEIVVPRGSGFSFEDLLLRIHPSESRINKLAALTPAKLLVFDLLVDERRRSLTSRHLPERRAQLERFAARFLTGQRVIQLSPATNSISTAKKWFELVGEGMDGVVAKRIDLPYQSGLRTGMVKIKRLRTADCVVGGFRYATHGRALGSLLLGLYDERGLLNHVGFTSSFTAQQRQEFLRKVEPLAGPPGFTGNAPGGPSRWSTERSSQWTALKTKLVVEVRFDHFSEGRFRHGTKFMRWRPDKAPGQCTAAQVERESKISPLTLLTPLKRHARQPSAATK
jgi:ATP-dependent DNA ligase